jgi:hypothetical protein
MTAELRMKSCRRVENASLRAFHVLLRPQLVAGQSSLLLGFRGSPESTDACGTRSGEIPIFSELPLFGSCGADLRLEKETRVSKPSYDGSAKPAVTRITVVGDDAEQE